MKNRTYMACLISVLLIVLFLFSGCGDKTASSTETTAPVTAEQAPENEGSVKAAPESHITDPDLDSYKISEEEAAERLKESQRVSGQLSQWELEYRNRSEITEDNLSDYLDEIENKMNANQPEGITYWERDEDSIYIELKSGGVMIYQPDIEGIDAAGSTGRVQISTYQPSNTENIGRVGSEVNGYLDEAARNVDRQFDEYEFTDNGTDSDCNYDDEEVSLGSIFDFGQNYLVLWHGHGGWNERLGSFLCTGVTVTQDNLRRYATYLDERSLIQTGSGHYAITAVFITNHFQDEAVQNCIFYLGACDSFKSTNLADALIAKGAVAVFGNSETVFTRYNLSMARDIFDRACQKNGDRYYTLDEALTYAKEQNGQNDGHQDNPSETVLRYASGRHDLTLDWFHQPTPASQTGERDIVLVLDRSGSMSGEPLTETKKAADQFVDTVFAENCRIGLVTYDTWSGVNAELTTDSDRLHKEIDGLYAGDMTDIYDAMADADSLLDSSQAEKKIIVLMTDGLPNEGQTVNGSYAEALIQQAEMLKNKGYYVYTLGFFQSLDPYDLPDAQSLLEQMASPGYHYEVNAADDLVFFFDDIAGQINGTQYVYIRIACPVNVTVSANGETLSSAPENENTRTSFGTLTYTQPEQESTTEYDMDAQAGKGIDPALEDDQVKILRLRSDQDYDISIEGYDDGSMDYTVSYPNENGEYDDVRDFQDIPVSASMKAKSNTAASDSSYLKVDQDGDGTYEKTYQTPSNGQMQEVHEEASTETQDNTMMVIIIVVCVSAGILILIIALAVNGRKKKSDRQLRSVSGQRPGQIVGLAGSFKGRVYPMEVEKICVIGRESSCNIQILHKKVSRVHCTVMLRPDGSYQVVDRSTNGTWFENQKLERGRPYQLPRGALLVIGEADNVLQLQ